ncbi:MAG: class I SAM-dependent methyltransferase [Planctomycetota bacterium]|jgi:SAM-dependent methyltransferase
MSDYLDPYRQAVQRFGPGFEATLWGSREAQRTRFDVMIDMVDLSGRVVLDVGCGDGALAVRLHERGIAFDRYTGVDGLPEVIASARDRDLPRCAFRALDVVAEPAALPAADVACISGTLNTMKPRTARAVVQAAFDAAAVAVVFNFLSDRPAPRWRRRDLGPARRFDTVAWIDWALRLGPRVRFRQDYLDGHDATIAVWKSDG